MSDILRDITSGPDGPVNVEAVIERLGRKGFGPVLMALGVPMLAPLPPGAPLIFAVPLFFVCLQMIAGRHTLWLPRFISKKTVTRKQLGRLMKRVMPPLEWVERHVKPRAGVMVEGVGERIMGLTCTVVAVVLVLPVPFANLVPSMAITAFGLALARKDGLMAMVGYGLVAISIAVIWLCLQVAAMGWRVFAAHWFS